MLRTIRKTLCLGLIFILMASLLAVPVLAADLAITSNAADKTTAAVGETITWTAAAAGGSGTLRYCFYVYKGSTIVEKGTYSTSVTYSYTPTEAGTYKAKAFVKDGAGASASKLSGNTTVSAPITISSVTADKSTAAAGEAITWTASATGGSGTLRYCFYIYRDGATVEKGTYTTAQTYTYTPTGAGTYKAKAFVKDGAGASASKLSGNTTVSSAPLAVAGVSANKTAATTGEAITWTVSATGGSGTLRYCFYVYKGSTIVEKSGYGASTTHSYTPETPGTYRVKAYVKDGAGASTSKLSGNTAVYEPLEITDVNCLGDLLPEWSYIRWIADVSGGSGSYKYNYYVYKYGISSAIEKSGWIDSDSYDYLAETAGDYTAKVFVKDVKTGVTVSLLCDSYAIIEPAEYWDSEPLEITDVVIDDGDGYHEGDDLWWDTYTCGGVGPIKYKYRVYRYGQPAPIEESDWSSISDYTYHNAAIGKYAVEVFVKDKNGTGETVSLMSDWINVEEYKPLEIVDVWTCGELFGAPANIGWEVEVTGGSGNLQYNYYVYKYGTSSAIEKSGWIKSDEYTYHNASEGDYLVKVFVRDLITGERVDQMCGNYITVEPAEYWD